MQAKQLTPNGDAERIWALVLDPGEDPVRCIESFARERRLSAARITAIGALERATLAGALLERWAVFRAGFQSARDPKFTVGPQRERTAARGG